MLNEALGVGGLGGGGVSSLIILLLITYSFYITYINWGKEMHLHSLELKVL